MTRKNLQEAFAAARAEGRAALIAYLAAGDPDLERTIELASATAEGGADIIELGIPFSDPLADGPIIQSAYRRALAGGTTVKGILGILPAVVEGTGRPVVLMTSYNPVLAYGPEDFCRDAGSAGASALLVPDLLPEESGALAEASGTNNLDMIHLVAPDTTDRRLAEAAAHSTGFLYLVSRRGVTGPDGGVGSGLEAEVARAREHTDLPVAVGFGVSSAADARRVAQVADGVIVGSALVSAATESPSPADAVREFTAELMEGIRR